MVSVTHSWGTVWGSGEARAVGKVLTHYMVVWERTLPLRAGHVVEQGVGWGPRSSHKAAWCRPCPGRGAGCGAGCGAVVWGGCGQLWGSCREGGGGVGARGVVVARSVSLTLYDEQGPCPHGVVQVWRRRGRCEVRWGWGVRSASLALYKEPAPCPLVKFPTTTTTAAAAAWAAAGQVATLRPTPPCLCPLLPPIAARCRGGLSLGLVAKLPGVDGSPWR